MSSLVGPGWIVEPDSPGRTSFINCWLPMIMSRSEFKPLLDEVDDFIGGLGWFGIGGLWLELLSIYMHYYNKEDMLRITFYDFATSLTKQTVFTSKRFYLK